MPRSSSTDATFIQTARREQIIASATDALAEVGYGRASLAEIGRRAGISKSVISYYFGSRDELIEAIVFGIYTRGAEEMAEEMATRGSEREQLRFYIETNIRFIAGNPKAVQALGEIFFNHRGPDGTSPFSIKGEAPIIEALEAGFRAGQASGEYRQFDTRVAADMVRAAIDRSGAVFAAFPDIDPIAYADGVADLVLAAIQALPDLTQPVVSRQPQ